MAEVETHSETWEAIEAWRKRRRAELVASLIQGSAGDDKLRGRIAMLDELADLARDSAPPDVTTATDY